MNPLEEPVMENISACPAQGIPRPRFRTVGMILLACASVMLLSLEAVADPTYSAAASPGTATAAGSKLAAPEGSAEAAADSAQTSLEGADPAVTALARDLSACLPPANETWEAEPVEIDIEKSDLPKGRIDAYRFYRKTAVGDSAQVLIRIERSAWDVWLVNFASDLQRLKFGARDGIMDLSKHAAIIYVPISGDLCAVFKAEDEPKKVEQIAKDFASQTDFDCLARVLKK